MCGTRLIVRSCLPAGLRPSGVPVGFAPLSPLCERSFDDGGIAETENQGANDKETVNDAHAKLIVQVIWLDHVDFILVADFLRFVPAGGNPRFDRAATCLFADHAFACFGNSESADDLDLEARF